DLYGGLDDDMSICKGPESGWGKIIDKGIDVFQTEWPAILKEFRAEKLKEKV
ncbi:MAG: glycerophosphodiester phosphodiesterase, partial [Clostridia bacterium]|nr:glycerophosphodiester phosphodiesterase [Clostridia bacterium]